MPYYYNQAIEYSATNMVAEAILIRYLIIPLNEIQWYTYMESKRHRAALHSLANSRRMPRTLPRRDLGAHRPVASQATSQRVVGVVRPQPTAGDRWRSVRNPAYAFRARRGEEATVRDERVDFAVVSGGDRRNRGHATR